MSSEINSQDQPVFSVNEVMRAFYAMSNITDRAALSQKLGLSFGGKRDYYSELGYKQKPTFEDYYNLYRREIAGRIIDLPVDTTFKGGFKIWEQDNPNDTPFEKSTAELLSKLDAINIFKRVDKLAGIGRFALLFIGTRGNADLKRPLRQNLYSTPDSILYLSVFSEANVQASSIKLDDDPRSDRYGKPLSYTIRFGTEATTEKEVHWTRVIHIAENLLENDVLGIPRLERVINRFEDLIKTVGGSAEMFWQNAVGALHADMRDDFTLEPNSPDAQSMKDNIDAFAHRLKKYLFTQGVDIDRLKSETPDPTGNYDTIKELIAASADIPVRILFGSERGELASSMDQDNFYDDIEQRRLTYAESTIIKPLIDRFMWLGVLERKDYQVHWEPLKTMTPKEKAEIGKAKSQTLRAYVGAQGDIAEVMPIHEFRSEVMDLEPTVPEPPK